ncbi:terminase large subunit domain-containing protein [Dysgonomonas sp. 520]|uniref:terminase large subunit domain-containing protein n=1 Tax=Dysgonomonas sp. 520 TaxID=2302931 RepID=UPI0013D5E068|nr:terminase family protein [Dysgonomonas sp. 520]NDW10699.1 hypothetical protein [Dysgonomonas sp. 520]
MSKAKHIKGNIINLHNRQNEVKKNTPKSQPSVQLYTPHSGQKQIHNWLLNNPSVKYLILACGRRFGKSLAMLNQALFYALSNTNEKIIFLTPTYKLAKELFEVLHNSLGDNFHYYLSRKGNKAVNVTDLKFKFSTNSTIQFFSFEKPENLRGLSASRIFVDESALMNDDCFNAIVKPIASLAKTVIALSTPRGKVGWFSKLFQMGLNSYYTNYKSFTFPTSANPMISSDELQDAKDNLPEHIYLQEYEAEFIDNASNLFKNIDNCINNDFNYNVGDRVVCGVDIGRVDDKTVITCMRVSDKQVIYQDSWNKLDYNVIVDKVAAVINHYKPIDTIVETNSIGDFFFDALKLKTKHKLTSFYTLQQNKNYIIENLILAFEKGDIKILNNADLINELNNFSATWNAASRTIKYAARSGCHDDYVMSLSFAYECCRRNTNIGKLSYTVVNMGGRNRY